MGDSVSAMRSGSRLGLSSGSCGHQSSGQLAFPPAHGHFFCGGEQASLMPLSTEVIYLSISLLSVRHSVLLRGCYLALAHSVYLICLLALLLWLSLALSLFHPYTHIHTHCLSLTPLSITLSILLSLSFTCTLFLSLSVSLSLSLSLSLCR